MRGLKRLRSAGVISAGHAFVQNLRRGHYELGVDATPPASAPNSLHRTRPRHLIKVFTPARCARTPLMQQCPLDDHRAERGEFVRQLLEQAGIHPAHGVEDGPYLWERTAPADPDIPSRPVLLLHTIAERQRWKAEYTAAQLAAGQPPPDQDCSATRDQAA